MTFLTDKALKFKNFIAKKNYLCMSQGCLFKKKFLTQCKKKKFVVLPGEPEGPAGHRQPAQASRRCQVN